MLQAKVYGQDQWKTKLRPRIDGAQVQAKQQYDKVVAPQIERLWAQVEPYYSTSCDRVAGVYYANIVPAYTVARPHVERVYTVVEKFAAETGIPYAKSGWAYTVVLFDRTIWPRLRILYGENVEPQLVRIGERLGRYRDGRKLKAAVEDIDGEFESSSAASSMSSISSSISSSGDTESLDPSFTAVSEPSTPPSPSSKQEEEQVREKIANDLKSWQEKFAKAADKGTDDLEQRVKEIADRQIESQVHGVGEALVVQLEESSKSESLKLKKTIIRLINSMPSEPNTTDAEKTEEEISTATRQAGLNVRSKAQALRNWKENFDRETISLVTAASESTLDVIDSIRDLGLQEIGMRWAWMEGVTYKDWSKYHSVKKTFDEWRKEVESVATDHEGLQKARDAATELETKGMAVAEDTAKELRRLKEVGKWKIQAVDASDDFDISQMPAGAVKIGQKVLKEMNSANEQLAGATEALGESIASVVAGSGKAPVERVVSAAKETVEQVYEQASEATAKTPSSIQDYVTTRSESLDSSATSIAASKLSSLSSTASQASQKVYGGAMAQAVSEQKPILDDVVDEDETYSEKMQSLLEQAEDKYADVTKAVSEALLKATSTQGTVESVTSVADEQYSKALAAASSALFGTPQGTVESLTSAASEKYAEAVAA